ncbi:MAG: radical SAM protein, partial [Candidatus Wallbacteria bacterium]|nr:radical SAM protein [Candidatus Wallbacteria bacterium]
DEELTAMMLDLSTRGAENLNLVTPTHFLPSVVAALIAAKKQGFALPVVYNTSGYEDPEIIRLLGEIVDVWLPDIKYTSDDLARTYSGCEDYPAHNRAALVEMKRMQPEVVLKKGLARKGLIVRHLVLPGEAKNSRMALDFIARELGRDTWISLMSQYFPAYKAKEYPGLSRRLSPDEYEELVVYAESLGLSNVFIQEIENTG